ncbi:MAG: type III secretion system export apparatus subunit SctV [Thiotrichaceae bacterium]|nr:type III secretion system export apparatus subunit SctV [Thiotrichaceae bacterium]
MQEILLNITKRNDIVLAIFLVTIAFIMILPMPTWILDLFIALNMGGTIMLMVISVYLPSPLSFSAFPSVLLLTTLFRLSLSIASTRLILLQADAGQIITTFGDFVVAGNLVVGFVVFLIITIVQFIVITKGSERVAEVGARFSLDAMPGKQMSIDSDLRSGVITVEEARTKRTKLEKESQLYGSMDGALKFVKGDAIAGMVIIFVNILGGISVGMLQQGLSVGEAASIYSILTIGDGLVSQIPALFISITAGIIVTRVAVDENTNLGQDIGTQLLAQPNALLISSAVVFLMSFVPGFPTAIFMIIGIVLGTMGVVMSKVNNHKFHKENIVSVIGTEDHEQDSVAALQRAAKNDQEAVTPVLVEITSNARNYLTPSLLNTKLVEIRRHFYRDMGVVVQGISLRLNDEMGDDGYRISIQGVPVAEGQLGLNRVFVKHSKKELDGISIPYQQGDDFLPGLPTLWVEKNYEPQLNQHDVTMIEPEGILAFHLDYVLKANAGQFIGIQEVHGLFTKLETLGYGELVKETQQHVPLPKVTEVLRKLVDEQISIKNLRQILETLAEWGETEKNTAALTEYVRSGLKRQISHAFTYGSNVLPVYLLDPATESMIQQSIRQTPNGSHLALDENSSERLRAALTQNEEQARILADLQARPVLLTSIDLRRFLSAHMGTIGITIPVLSFEELTRQVQLRPIGKIEIAG